LEKDVILENYASSRLTDANALMFEANFKRCLADDWIIEPSKKRSREFVDIRSTMHIGDSIYWCFIEKSFVFEHADIISMPIISSAVVSSVTNHWRENLLNQCLQNRRREPILIITENADQWVQTIKTMSLDFVIASEAGLSKLPDVVFLAPNMIAASVMKSMDVYETISHAMNAISSGLGTTKSHAQIRRYVKDNLALKFPEFNVPVDFHTFNMCICDGDFSFHCSRVFDTNIAKKFLRVFKSDDMKPFLALNQLRDVLGLMSSFAPLAASLYEASIIGVPKTILKKFKIVGHLIKNGNIEDRISKTFRDMPCPLDDKTAIERFSGKTMPVSTVKDLIRRHFERTEVTFGCYLLGNGPSFPLSKAFIEEAFDVEKRCAICFDLLESIFGLTLCGHIYCRDCSKQYFKPHWALFQTKECAHCRTPLTSGDYFCVDKDCAYETTLASKELSINSFKSGLRPKQIETWPTEVASKYLIIQNIDQVTPQDIVKTFHDSPHSINVHVFYTTFEAHRFHTFQTSFV
jgi:hypothetical protein